MEVNQLADGVLELSLCDDSSDMEIDLTEVDDDAHNHNEKDASTIIDEHQSEAGVNVISSKQSLSYKIVGDNLDTKIKPHHMRKDRQSRMLNYFHSYSAKSRITSLNLCSQKSHQVLENFFAWHWRTFYHLLKTSHRFFCSLLNNMPKGTCST